MKRFTVSLVSTILAFTAGLVTASSWTSDSHKAVPVVTATVTEPCPPTPPPPPPAPVKSFTVTPPQEFDFGQKGLKLVPERVQLKSESLGYEIDVSYPQIVGTPATDPTNIRKVNQHLKDSATKLYQWPLKAEPQGSPFQARSGIRNTVSFTYQVGLATDSLLSVQFIGYGYDGGNGRQLQESFSRNFDLTSGKQLKLSELFKPGANYLGFISRYCTQWLVSTPGLNTQGLASAVENFAIWQVTPNGIMFNFNACQVADCAEGEQRVEIPFSELKPLLNTGIPGKFQITYP